MSYFKKINKSVINKNKCKHDWVKSGSSTLNTKYGPEIYDYYTCRKCKETYSKKV